MERIVAVLLAVTLAACGSSSAGPKTSNPPLKPNQTAKNTPDPAAQPQIEQEGLTIKFNVFGFKLTLPSDAWQGKLMPQPDGSMQIMFLRPDVPIIVFIRPVTSDQFDLKGIAEAVHKDAAGALPAGSTGALAQEPNGRWSFTVEVARDDGTKFKGYLGVQEIGSGQKLFLISTTILSADLYDANIAEPLSMLDSVAPLK